MPNDDVIQHRNIHHLSCFDETVSDFSIFMRRRGFSGGMIVKQNDASCGFQHRRLKHFPRMNQRLIQYTLGDLHIFDQNVGAVQQQNHEHFFLQMRQDRLIFPEYDFRFGDLQFIRQR